MKKLRCHSLVIGSGPGGQITAHRLREAGHDVVVVERGSHRTEVGNPKRHSWQEVCQMYAKGGANPAFGRRPLNIAEADCVGGGGEINAGLYWRLPEEERMAWQKDFNLSDLSAASLQTIYTNLEKQIDFAADRLE